MTCMLNNCGGTAIQITAGDDSNALGNTITIKLTTDVNLTGYSMIFELCGQTWTFDDITSGEVPLQITREQSIQFPTGTQYGAIKIFDEYGLCKTVLTDIPFYVKPLVVKNPTTNATEE